MGQPASKELTLAVECMSPFGYDVHVWIKGWPEPRKMDCVKQNPVTWETRIDWGLDTQLVYKFFLLHPADSDRHRLFEDGNDYEVLVDSSTPERLHHCWRQDSENLYDFRLTTDRDRHDMDRLVRSFDQMGRINITWLSLWLVPHCKRYPVHHDTIICRVYVERRTTWGERVTEVFQYPMRRQFGRYSLGGIKLQMNDCFWDVGPVTKVEVGFLLCDTDANGEPFGTVRGSRVRYQLLNRDDGHIGRRTVMAGDDHYGWRAPDMEHAMYMGYESPMWVNFTRNSDVRQAIIHLINEAKYSIHCCVYNICDEGITTALINAKARGLDVQILTSSDKSLSQQFYENKEFKRLTLNRVSMISVKRHGQHASMHTKVAIFDGKRVLTGSCNWERRSVDVNHESIIYMDDSRVAEIYMCIFQTIQGHGPLRFPENNDKSRVKVYYTPYCNMAKVYCDEIHKAHKRINIVMFVMRPVVWWDGSTEYDVAKALIAAKDRGVKVTCILEKNTHDGGQYKARQLPADHTHHHLMDCGIKCIKVKTNWHGDACAAIHEKFMVVDGRITVTGSANLWPASRDSDDDLLVINDMHIAWEHEMEMQRILNHFSPSTNIW